MLETLPSGSLDFVLLNAFSVFAVSIFIYDALLKLDKEVEFVWRQPWSLNKILYLLCRYLFAVVIITTFSLNASINPPEKLCRAWQDAWMWIFPNFSAVFSDAMILLRIGALYPTEPKIRYLTMAIFTIHVLLSFTFWGINSRGRIVVVLSHISPEDFQQQGCKIYLYQGSHTLAVLSLITPVLAQAYYFSVIFYKFVNCAREVKMRSRPHFNSMLGARGFIPIHFALLRDAAVFFFVAMLMYVLIVTMVVLPSASPTLWLPGVIMIMTVNPLLASRLYLNMKDRGQIENNARLLAFGEDLRLNTMGVPDLRGSTNQSTCDQVIVIE